MGSIPAEPQHIRKQEFWKSENGPTDNFRKRSCFVYVDKNDAGVNYVQNAHGMVRELLLQHAPYPYKFIYVDSVRLCLGLRAG